VKKCDCGCHAVDPNSNNHSDWCSLVRKDTVNPNIANPVDADNKFSITLPPGVSIVHNKKLTNITDFGQNDVDIRLLTKKQFKDMFMKPTTVSIPLNAIPLTTSLFGSTAQSTIGQCILRMESNKNLHAKITLNPSAIKILNKQDKYFFDVVSMHDHNTNITEMIEVILTQYNQAAALKLPSEYSIEYYNNDWTIVGRFH